MLINADRNCWVFVILELIIGCWLCIFESDSGTDRSSYLISDKKANENDSGMYFSKNNHVDVTLAAAQLFQIQMELCERAAEEINLNSDYITFPVSDITTRQI